MSEEKSLSIPINSKTIGTIITIIIIISGIIGTWYVNNDRLDKLEERMKAVEQTGSTAPETLKTEIKTEIAKIEKESKERDNKLEATNKEDINNLTNKMEQVEDSIHDTQLTVGSISQDIKNVSANISEIKDNIKSIHKEMRRKVVR